MMRNQIFLLWFAAIMASNVCAKAQGTAFTYQGRLAEGTSTASGSYDFRFSIWDVAEGGNRIGSVVTNLALPINNGLFTALLDFGGVFDGNGRWLEVGVRTNGGSTFNTLSPRQVMTASPYAIYSGGVSATGISGTIPANNIANGTITSNMLAAGAAAANLAANGQSSVSSGAMILSPNPNAANLTGSGYAKFGGPVDMCWQPRANHTSGAAFRTGIKVLVWDASYGGASFDPTINSWTAINTNNSPVAGTPVTGSGPAVWTGNEMLVCGGYTLNGYHLNGGRYNPTTDQWASITTNGAPSPRFWQTAVWTGNEMIVWGGTGYNGFSLNTGARYNPTTDQWFPVSINGAPSPREHHTAIWTGTEMIVWGGDATFGGGVYTYPIDAARYNAATDTWSPVATNTAVLARVLHTAIWTGSEMIIWGGTTNYSIYFNNGGRYNPATDSWTPVTINHAPNGRAWHTAVWTGSEMIIFGGENIPSNVINPNESAYTFNDGGRYNLSTDSWTPTETSGAPAVFRHSAIWTGNEMILLGGPFPSVYSYSPNRLLYLYLRQ